MILLYEGPGNWGEWTDGASLREGESSGDFQSPPAGPLRIGSDKRSTPPGGSLIIVTESYKAMQSIVTRTPLLIAWATIGAISESRDSRRSENPTPIAASAGIPSHPWG